MRNLPAPWPAGSLHRSNTATALFEQGKKQDLEN
jgi:hypothetical protein